MLSPGTYVQKRRVAASLSIFDVAMRIDTGPLYREIDKVAWLRRIEADIAALSPDVITSLAAVFPFSRDILQQLITLRNFGPGAGEQPRLCQLCGCSADDACIDQASGETCAWVEPDLCTRCAPTPEQEAARAA